MWNATQQMIWQATLLKGVKSHDMFNRSTTIKLDLRVVKHLDSYNRDRY